tara:strand:+ start:17418 stop:18788 length:1371 start_codon:yes stop_codon:yes gene_type:complete
MKKYDEHVVENNFFSSIILYLLVSTLFLHFLKATYIEYSFLLASFFLVALMYNPNKIFYFNSQNKIFRSSVILFFFLIILVSVWSFNFYNYPLAKGYVDTFDMLNGIMRMLLMPLTCISLYLLINHRDQYIIILKIYIIFIILAALSMIVQQFIGHIALFGTVGPPRFTGLMPYPSIAGNITVFPAIIGIALLLLISKVPYKLNLFYKTILISLVIVAGFLSLQKAAFVNLGLGIAFGFFLLTYKEIYTYVIFAILFSITTYLIFPNLFLSIFSLIANTTGVEILDNTIHRGIYEPIYVKFFDRILAANWRTEPLSTLEFFTGYGVLGGTDMFGFMFNTTSNTIDPTHNPNGFALGSKHNMYFQLYQIGGIFLPIIFILVLILAIINLYRMFNNHQDYLALILCLCNINFLINCIVHNGALFHPYISFTFWLSIAYLVGPHSINASHKGINDIKVK